MKISFPIALLIAASSTALSAQNLPADDPAPGYSAIMKADYATAEREIRGADISEYDAARTINLGVVLAKTGRQDAAALMFHRAMMLDNVSIVVAGGDTLSSHDVAGRALALLRAGYFNR